ncbi:MAG: hypothetical protein MUD12_04840 [Spirochaetes bacterium]|jgi:hypothetical protein|nr:hypothetical protein [Spirochaetota bacterium]
MKNKIPQIIILTLILCTVFSAADAGIKDDGYRAVVQNTASMVGDSKAQSMAQKFGLNILNVTWEDTGRYKGSSVGPNISDMTIQVQQKDPKTGKYFLSCMPVIRHPNFSDESADISPEHFYILVGNEKGKKPARISLRDYLENIRKYMTDPSTWKGSGKSLLAKRDSHVLVSAQACFLPVPKNGIAEFNPVIFNYQSYGDDPAVLTILATREGTSVTVIDNKRDAFQAGMTWGQRLFFNQKGERASLTGKRLSDFLADNKNSKKTKSGNSHEAASESGMNMVMLIQVPLKQKRVMRFKMACEDSSKYMKSAPSAARSDVEAAVIGHGKVEGPFTEIGGLAIERDDRYPIRVTVQFYKATSNGQVSEADVKEISEQIKRVYKRADYVGSLVVSGNTARPTEYDGPKFEPPDWWDSFWKRHKENTGLTPGETIKMLRKLYGPNWKPGNEKEFEKQVDMLKGGRKKSI